MSPKIPDIIARLRELAEHTTDPASRDALEHVIWLLNRKAHPVNQPGVVADHEFEPSTRNPRFCAVCDHIRELHGGDQ